MALILPGGGVTDIRGSIAGTTFSRNAGGNYIRARTKPVNPNTSRQQTVRAVMAFLATYWRDTLSAADRTAWASYAASTSWLNALGQTIKLSGQQMFVRSSSARYALSGGVADPPPSTPGIPGIENLWTPSATISTNKISIAFTFPTNVDDQSYLFYAGVPISPGRTFFNGPWQYIGPIHGNNSSPPASPQLFDYPWTLGTGQKVFVYCRRIDADNRLNEPFQQSCTPA